VYVANRRRASAVVVARRPGCFGKLLAWRSRDARLRRLLAVPLVLVDASLPVDPDDVPAFDLQPNHLETTRDLRQRAA
jgi:hypothetical protein